MYLVDEILPKMGKGRGRWHGVGVARNDKEIVKKYGEMMGKRRARNWRSRERGSEREKKTSGIWEKKREREEMKVEREEEERERKRREEAGRN